MNSCDVCIRKDVCQKAKHVENYKIKSKCGDFIDSDWREILSELSLEQIGKLMEFADSLRKNGN